MSESEITLDFDGLRPEAVEDGLDFCAFQATARLEEVSDLGDAERRGCEDIDACANRLLERFQPFTDREREIIALALKAGYGFALLAWGDCIDEWYDRMHRSKRVGERLIAKGKRGPVVDAVTAELRCRNNRTMLQIYDVVAAAAGVDAGTVKKYWLQHLKRRREEKDWNI